MTFIIAEVGSKKSRPRPRRTPTWITWSSMRQRCANPNHPMYKYYGGRGVTVCERWNVYKNFLADVGERPTGKTLDRIDNNGNYEPGNCRWATPSEQIKNRRPLPFGVRVSVKSKSGVVGVYRERDKWIAVIRINGKQKKIGRYDTIAEAKEAYDSNNF